MRKVNRWTLLPAAALAFAACGKSDAHKSATMADDLKRDLQLANQQQRIQISPDEITPKSHQELATRPKKAPNGPRVIRTEHPTVKASALPVEAAETKSEMPQVQVMASAPAPSETPSPDAPPLARPSPVPAQTYPGAQPIPENGGSGGILGGIFGAVIRGGIVGGDDDHCDPRPRPRGGRPIGGDVITRSPGGYPGPIGGIHRGWP